MDLALDYGKNHAQAEEVTFVVRSWSSPFAWPQAPPLCGSPSGLYGAYLALSELLPLHELAQTIDLIVVAALGKCNAFTP